jgi:membrane-bound lytic murein transglycosylase D
MNGEIEVQQGMTWYQISRFYKKPLDSLFTWNSGISRELKVGQKIRVEAVTKPFAGSAAIPVPQKETDFEWYEVRQGDSAYSIARKFSMKIEEFLEFNKKEDAALRLGDKVKVKKLK